MPEPVVVDLRGPGVRLVESAWRAWERHPRAMPAAASRGAAAVWRRLLARRRGRRPAPPARPLVVSVGNLRVGGTGKTPVVIALAAGLSRRGVGGAVLTRGYGSGLRGPAVVRPDDQWAGDEARLMAARLPAWTVLQARDRAAALAAALAREPRPRLVILEDGHQSAGPGRHLDVLLLDRWRLREGRVEPRTGLTLPWGPYREGPEGAAAADVWLVETQDAGPWRGGPDGRVPVLGFRRRLEPPPAGLPDGPCAVVSGIGRPERFEADCARLLGRAPVLAVRCDDHARYGRRLLERVLAAGRRHGARAWLTTEKDLVKLAGRWPDGLPLLAPRLRLEWSGSETLPDLVEERLAGGS